ncbi:hypothetical protein VDGL01_01429 [Verticillium dahliae]
MTSSVTLRPVDSPAQEPLGMFGTFSDFLRSNSGQSAAGLMVCMGPDIRPTAGIANNESNRSTALVDAAAQGIPAESSLRPYHEVLCHARAEHPELEHPDLPEHPEPGHPEARAAQHHPPFPAPSCRHNDHAPLAMSAMSSQSQKCPEW